MVHSIVGVQHTVKNLLCVDPRPSRRARDVSQRRPCPASLEVLRAAGRATGAPHTRSCPVIEATEADMAGDDGGSGGGLSWLGGLGGWNKRAPVAMAGAEATAGSRYSECPCSTKCIQSMMSCASRNATARSCSTDPCHCDSDTFRCSK